MIHLNTLACLHAEDPLHSCRVCLTFCPFDVFIFDTNELKTQTYLCQKCGVCIGLCPSHALSLDTPSSGITMTLISQKGYASCQQNIPCLAFLSPFQWFILSLHTSLKVDMSHCSQCSLIQQRNILFSKILSIFNEINHILDFLNFPIIHLDYQSIPSRRHFFSSISHNLKKFSLPLKHDFSPSLPDSSLILPPLSFISHKKIIKENCNYCLSCVQFCPTQALHCNEQGDILFRLNDCIHCKICYERCLSNAIINQPFSLNDLSSIHILYRSEYITCPLCKTTFHQKNDEYHCPQCEELKKLGIIMND